MRASQFATVMADVSNLDSRLIPFQGERHKWDKFD